MNNLFKITKDIFMKLAIILIILLIFILFIPLRLRGKIIYNAISNNGYISFYFYKINVFLAEFKPGVKSIKLQTNKKNIEFEFFKKEEDYALNELFIKNLLRETTINNVKIITKIGLFNNNLLSCNICGILNTSLSILRVLTKRVKRLQTYFFPDFLMSRALFCLTISVQFNIFLILLSFLKSLMKIIKRGKFYGNKKAC